MASCQEPKIRALSLLASGRCCVALMIGVLPALPVVLPHIPFEFHQSYRFSVLPKNEEALENWLREQPNVSGIMAVRYEDGKVEIRFTRRGFNADALHPPMRDLGYAGLAGGHFSSSIHYAAILADPFFALVLLLSSQSGFLVVGIWWLRSARRQGRPLPNLFDGPWLRSCGYGVLLGGILVAVGLGYDALIRLAPIGVPDTAGVWRAITGISKPSLVIVLAGGCLGAPICEEIFFRGAIFGSFKAAHQPMAGGVFSALLFAFVHLDPVNVIPFFAFGLVTAWAYHRTRSLATTIVAHCVNNAVGFALILC